MKQNSFNKYVRHSPYCPSSYKFAILLFFSSSKNWKTNSSTFFAAVSSCSFSRSHKKEYFRHIKVWSASVCFSLIQWNKNTDFNKNLEVEWNLIESSQSNDAEVSEQKEGKEKNSILDGNKLAEKYARFWGGGKRIFRDWWWSSFRL